MTEGAFFQDLAILMSIAGGAAIVFSRLGWPKVLGYILVGVLMGEHTWGGGFLIDPASTRTIGQLGVVFLMFGMGLSFSPREMKRIRSVALPAALFDTAVMIGLGYFIGTRVFGWASAPSVFLGVAICDSATTLLAKVVDEMGWSRRPFASYILGTSICEDIVCVGAIAVATGFVTGGSMSARSFLVSIGGLGVFFLLVLVFGFILLPRLLKSVSKRRDDEALVLALLGCCFFISFFAYKFDFSLALGAFLVGIIGGSSDIRDRLERLVSPLKSMFSAVFFVSIGLLVDPVALMHHLPEILLVSALVMVGKFLNVTIASLATGLEVKTAIQNGFGLAQIGEFAFMVAILYAGLVKDSSNDLFPIAVGVSLLTTLLNPWMIRVSDPVGSWSERMLPERLADTLAAYRLWLARFRSSSGAPAYRRVRLAAARLGIYAALMLSVSVVLAMLHPVDYSRFSVYFERHDALFFFVLANIFSVALLPLVISSVRVLAEEVSVLLTEGSESKWKHSLRPFFRFVVTVGTISIFFFEWFLLDLATAPRDGFALAFSLAVIALTGIFGWRFFCRAGRNAVARFNEALSAEERRDGLAKAMAAALPVEDLKSLTLSASSSAIGGTVVSLDIRAKTGASIVAVRRDGVETRNIGGEWIFRAGDTVVALGDEAQIMALRALLEDAR